tara:strand:+ start:3638 stop:4006 length:369 start_codon:yes stop_codon:yes gene_type:complete
MKINSTDLNKLYSNDIGIIFKWKGTSDGHPYHDKINLVFNGAVLHFNLKELYIFQQDVGNALKRPLLCESKYPKECKSILLETPLSQLSFAMSYNDLILMQELIEGSFFQIALSNILQNILE